MYTTLVILTLGLVGCGQIESQSAIGTSEKQDSSAQASVAKRSISINTDKTLYFELKSDMPACDTDHHRQLIYVKEESKFFYCDLTEWVSIEIKGEKGDKGEKGEVGAAGKSIVSTMTDTATTTSTQTATVTVKEKAKLPSLPNMWVDPVTGYGWFIGNNYSRANVVDHAFLCPSNAASPTEDEMKDAIMSGILEKYRDSSKDTWLWIGSNVSTRIGTALYVAMKPRTGDGQIVDIDPNSDYNASKTFHLALCVIKPQ